MAGPQNHRGQANDLLLLSIASTAAVLGVLYVGLFLYWGHGPVIAVIPWFIPMMSTFLALTSFSVAFLALGRYEVRRDPPSYWVGMGFAGFGIGLVFYVLSWPGLMPGGQSIIAHLSNTPAWMSVLAPSMLGLFLLAGVLVRWPGAQALAGRIWLWSVGAWLLFVMVTMVFLVAFEQYLPVLVRTDGTFTAFLIAWSPVLILMFVAGAVLSTRRYVLSGDALIGYIAFCQIAVACAMLGTILGTERYDLWWYLERIILISGSLIVLFGLLSEYVHLFRRERARTSELQDRSAEIEGVLASSPTAILVTDRSGNARLANKMALGLLGIQRVGEISSPASESAARYEICDQEGHLLCAQHLPLARVARGESFRNEEIQFRDLTGGSAVWILTSGGPLTVETGNLIGGVMVGVDITERKRAEEERERLMITLEEERRRAEALATEAEKLAEERGEHLAGLQELWKLKDDFLSTAAHELKTPVTVMKGYAQSLLRHPDQLSERQKHGLQTIDRGADRIARLVQDLLDISRFRGGAPEFQEERIDLVVLAEEVLQNVGRADTRHKLVLQVGEPTFVVGDRERLSQVLRSLVDNAVKFSPGGGEVRVGISRSNGKAVVSMTDEGIGIPREKQERVFEPFFRAHAGTPHDYGGMGVGLYLSREIIIAHEGEMWFEGEEGKESNFYFSLPLA